MPPPSKPNLVSDLSGAGIHPEVCPFIVSKLIDYDASALNIRFVDIREDKAYVIRYLDEWGNELTFVINIAA